MLIHLFTECQCKDGFSCKMLSNNPIGMQCHPASMLALVSDDMDAHNVHVLNIPDMLMCVSTCLTYLRGAQLWI